MKEGNRGRVSNVFQIVRSIQGPKKGGATEAHAVRNQDTGELAVTAKEIKRTSLEYCKKVLTNNEVQEEVKREVELKDWLHRERMKESRGKEVVPTKEVFNRVINKFKKNNKRNYDFLIRTGDGFKEAVFRLCKRMLEDEVFPASFDNTTLHQIYKGKGKREILSNSRFIHSKEWLPRTAEGMVVEVMKEVILSKSSPYQIGGQPGHRPQEHIFTVKSILAKYIREDKMIMLQAYDISKFFDKETVPDVMNTLHEMGVDGKCYRAWALLNDNTNIRVKTGVGYTAWSQEGAMIGQGTGGGALVSQANLDNGVVEMFRGSEEDVRYGGVRVLPVMFQDDIMRAAGSVEAARAGNIKMASVMDSKQLTLNPDKTGFLMFGKGKAVKEARDVISRSPLMCGNFATLEKVSDKWLGDIFHQAGLSASVMATVRDREPKVKAACYEAAAIVEDWRAQCVGGFRSAIDLWEMAVLPSLMYNAGTWVEISKETEEVLENLQLFFMRLVLRVPQGTPKLALRSETGLMSMRLRVYREKCLLVHHIRGLEENAMARMMYEEQRKNSWPGLADEVSRICTILRVEDGNHTSLSKGAYRRVVDSACRELDEKEMKEGMAGKTKLERLVNDDCLLKDYMNKKSLKDVRDTFRARTQLVEGIKGNFKNRHRNSDLQCQGCKSVEDTQLHVLVCAAYGDLRVGKDLEKDDDMVDYFREVVRRRVLEE